MQSSRTFISSLAIMAIIASVVWQRADAQEKYLSCCTRVSKKEVMDPIIGLEVQRPDKLCAAAVIVKTDKNEQFCCSPHAKWLKPKIMEFKRKLDRETQTKPSLLSRITRSSQKA
ncbi:C-C motif chemokine 2-like [Alosa sapidissima]|uniref:C-C motif chemokine 2-like n=1 Tax=Alosa sapidissima TaxID=34773 RepID=UPI001C080209|nr:C-C motif chemokine 2-like [Alosa sapidissima]